MLATLLHAMSEQQADRGSQRVERRLELSDDAVDPADRVHGELLGIVVGIDLRPGGAR